MMCAANACIGVMVEVIVGEVQPWLDDDNGVLT